LVARKAARTSRNVLLAPPWNRFGRIELVFVLRIAIQLLSVGGGAHACVTLSLVMKWVANASRKRVVDPRMRAPSDVLLVFVCDALPKGRSGSNVLRIAPTGSRPQLLVGATGWRAADDAS